MHMGSPISPIVSNLYMEQFEQRALASYTGITSSRWYRYVDDACVIVRTNQLDNFYAHSNDIHHSIKLTQEGLVDNKLPFLDCIITVEQDRSLSVSVFRKPSHTDQYLQFGSNHPLIQKLGVVKTLFHRADTIVTKD